MSDDAAAKVAQIIGDMDVLPLPPGEMATAAFLLIKTVDQEGSPSWYARTTDGISSEELLGSLVVQLELLRKDLIGAWIDSNADE